MFPFLEISSLVTSSWLEIHKSRVETMLRQDTAGTICQRLEIPRKEKKMSTNKFWPSVDYT